MHPHEIVMRVMKRDRCFEVHKILGEYQRQTRCGRWRERSAMVGRGIDRTLTLK